MLRYSALNGTRLLNPKLTLTNPKLTLTTSRVSNDHRRSICPVIGQFILAYKTKINWPMLRYLICITDMATGVVSVRKNRGKKSTVLDLRTLWALTIVKLLWMVCNSILHRLHVVRRRVDERRARRPTKIASVCGFSTVAIFMEGCSFF